MTLASSILLMHKCSTHTGVCHSDYSVMMNSWPVLPHPTQEGQVGGHEGVGKIVKSKKSAKDLFNGLAAYTYRS
jgi:D-arabinose 1-dehydrogenase-like Zn-dependent alcohol dehydrogenase